MWNAAGVAAALGDAGDYGFRRRRVGQRLASPEAKARRVCAALERHLRAQSRRQGRDLGARRRAVPRQEHGAGQRRAPHGAAHCDRHGRQSHCAGLAGGGTRHYFRRLLPARAAAEAGRRRRRRLRQLRTGGSIPRAGRGRGAVHPQGSFAHEFRCDARKIPDARNARARNHHPRARHAGQYQRAIGHQNIDRAGQDGIFGLRLRAMGHRSHRKRRRPRIDRRRGLRSTTVAT